jgi:hypothetical protein
VRARANTRRDSVLHCGRTSRLVAPSRTPCSSLVAEEPVSVERRGCGAREEAANVLGTHASRSVGRHTSGEISRKTASPEESGPTLRFPVPCRSRSWPFEALAAQSAQVQGSNGTRRPAWCDVVASTAPCRTVRELRIRSFGRCPRPSRPSGSSSSTSYLLQRGYCTTKCPGNAKSVNQ